MEKESQLSRIEPPQDWPRPAVMKCKIERDRFDRIIYRPGDGVGVVGTGPLVWLSKKQIRPSTDLFHFLIIGDYIEEDDDYIIFESIGKGTAVGRLSWYAKDKYTVFRLNDPDYYRLGKLAVERASTFGRRCYDWRLYLKLFAWAICYWAKEIGTLHIPPRPVYPWEIPYKSDRDFICIELYFAIWNLAGRRIRAHGHAPVPAEVLCAVNRGDLVIIDHHAGDAEKWREPRGSAGLSWVELGTVAENISRGDMVALGTDGLVYKTSGATGTEAEDITTARLFYDGGKLNFLICEVFGINSENVYRVLVDAKVGEIAKVTTWGFVKTNDREIDRLKEFVIKYELKPYPEAKAPIRPGPDLIARPKGQERNKYHVYRQPYGYPIRLCDWLAADSEELEIQSKPEGVTLKNYIYSHIPENRICLHCWAVLKGDRTSVGMDNKGHGKGAPTP